MKHQKVQSYMLILFTVILLSISFILEHGGRETQFFSFMLAIISLSISIAVKIILSQYSSYRQYNLLNALTITNIFKSVLLVVQSYNQFKGYNVSSLINIALQSSLLDIVGLIMAYYLTQKSIMGEFNTYIMIFASLMIWVVDKNVASDRMTVFIQYLGIFNFVIIGAAMIKRKKAVQSLLNEKIPFFQMFMVVLLIQQVFYWGLMPYEFYYETFLTATQFLQVFYLVHCALYVCLTEPWEQKVKAISEANETISRQNKNCDTIVSLSHELKTPVNVIRSALDILALDIGGKADKELKATKKKCNDLMNLIQDMIDIQKFNTGHIEVKLKNYNLVELLENVTDVFSDEVKGFRLIFNPQEEEIDQVVDGLLIQQCFMLLIGLMTKGESLEESYIEMGKDLESKQIYIKCFSSQIPYLKELNQQLQEMQNEEDSRYIEDMLTFKLIRIILTLHKAELVFKEEKELDIYFFINSTGKRAWLDERCIAVLNDQIRCRYIDS